MTSYAVSFQDRQDVVIVTNRFRSSGSDRAEQQTENNPKRIAGRHHIVQLAMEGEFRAGEDPPRNVAHRRTAIVSVFFDDLQ